MFKWAFLFPSLSPTPKPAPSAADQTAPRRGAASPNSNPARTRRVCVTMSNYPALVLEATPAGALDVQALAGIKRIEPDPRESEPDHCGSNYYTVMVSTLYDFRALLRAIEDLNEPDLPPSFLGE